MICTVLWPSQRLTGAGWHPVAIHSGTAEWDSSTHGVDFEARLEQIGYQFITTDGHTWLWYRDRLIAAIGSVRSLIAADFNSGPCGRAHREPWSPRHQAAVSGRLTRDSMA